MTFNKTDFPDEKLVELCDEYQRGIPVAALAVRYDVSASRVREYISGTARKDVPRSIVPRYRTEPFLDMESHDTNTKNGAMTHQEVYEMRVRHNAGHGESESALAKIYGRPKFRVREALLGHTFTSVGGPILVQDNPLIDAWELEHINQD